MLSSIQSRPCDSPGILSLEEEGFGFAVLEAEDFAVTSYVDLALCQCRPVSILFARSKGSSLGLRSGAFCCLRGLSERRGVAYFAWVDLFSTEGIVEGTHFGGLRYATCADGCRVALVAPILYCR